jgi:hypothetical protein
VIRAVKAFFNLDICPRDQRHNNCVTARKEELELLKDFRSISLCNVIYKVASKCLVSRLRTLLHDLIAPMQSAFVSGHLIIDNAFIAFKCLHAIEQGNNRCRNFGALKLDLTKAYDCME